MFVFFPIVTEILVVITQILDIFSVTIIAISLFQALMFSIFKKPSFPFSFSLNKYDIQSKNSKD